MEFSSRANVRFTVGRQSMNTTRRRRVFGPGRPLSSTPHQESECCPGSQDAASSSRAGGGPFMTAAARQQLSAAAPANTDVTVHDFVPNAEELLAGAAAVVLTAGYSSACKVLIANEGPLGRVSQRFAGRQSLADVVTVCRDDCGQPRTDEPGQEQAARRAAPGLRPADPCRRSCPGARLDAGRVCTR